MDKLVHYIITFFTMVMSYNLFSDDRSFTKILQVLTIHRYFVNLDVTEPEAKCRFTLDNFKFSKNTLSIFPTDLLL